MQAQNGHTNIEVTENQTKKGAQRINNPQRPRLLSLKEAATFLGIGIRTMRDLVWSGAVPLVRFKRRMYFDVRDLEQLIDRNKATYD
jgi:Helix-turn-helix domain